MKAHKMVLAALLALSGCQDVFRKADRRAEEPVAVRAKPVEAFPAVAYEDAFRPLADRPDVRADFTSRMQKPADPLLADCVAACLEEAYRRMRSEERADVSSTGVRRIRDAFVADYRERFDDDWASVTNDEATVRVAHWTCRVEGRVAFCGRDVFSYRVSIETSTGGPHPNRWIQNASYSRRDGHRLKVAEVVGRESMLPVLNRIRRSLGAEARRRGDAELAAQLAKEVRIPYDEYVRQVGGRTTAVDWGHPIVTENFMVVADGLSWVYNPCEVARYELGSFEVKITSMR